MENNPYFWFMVIMGMETLIFDYDRSPYYDKLSNMTKGFLSPLNIHYAIISIAIFLDQYFNFNYIFLFIIVKEILSIIDALVIVSKLLYYIFSNFR